MQRGKTALLHSYMWRDHANSQSAHFREKTS
jgi:hypothetical protein